MGKFEDASSIIIASHSAAGILLEVQILQNKFNKLQDKLNKRNVAKRQATQAAQQWQKACLAARAHNNLLTQEIYQLKQEHPKLGDWRAGSADVPPKPPGKHPKQPACSPPKHRTTSSSSKDATIPLETKPLTKNPARTKTKANGKGNTKGKDLKGKGKTKATGCTRQPRMPWATPIGGFL